MPRPAAKRTRAAKTAKGNTEKATEPPKQREPSKSPPAKRAPSVDPRQTPLRKNHDQAVDSSPTGGDHPGTGSRPGTASRPPTRSRGYSSTMSLGARKGETNARIPGTPGFDSSMLSNFRRRPRQQSILHMVQAEDGSSELDEDDFLGGLSPQDESTPLNTRTQLLTKRNGQSGGEGEPEAGEGSSRSPSPSQSLPSSGSSRKRKRERASNIEVRIEVQVPQSSIPEPTEPTDIEQVDDTPSATPIPRNTYPDELESTPQPLRFPDILSQTMLPPASSPASTVTTIPRSPVVVPKPGRGRKKIDPAHMSTAALQNKLLPRRRQRRQPRRIGEIDMSDEGEGDDDDEMHDAASGEEDELSYPPSRRSQSRGEEPAKPRPLETSRVKSKLNNPKQRRGRGRKSAAEKQQEPVDKENEEQPGDQSERYSSPLSSPPESDAESNTGNRTPRRFTSAELRAATQKFAEIDKWEMEFEDVSGSEA